MKRRHLLYYLQVSNGDTGGQMGHLVDITTEGLMLVSERPLELNKVHRIRIDLPTGVFGKDRLEFYAKSLWSKPDINPDFFDTGFLLQDAAPEDTAIIERVITHYGFAD